MIKLRITIKGLSENNADASVFVSITLNSVSWFSAKLGTHIPKRGNLSQKDRKAPLETTRWWFPEVLIHSQYSNGTKLWGPIPKVVSDWGRV